MLADESQRLEVRFLVFAASLRDDSLNARLADLACACIEANGGIAERASMAEFDCPSYNFDVQTGEGFPAGAQAFNERLQSCDAFVIASP
jgi:NAD(P)H-dependent FMN reductase